MSWWRDAFERWRSWPAPARWGSIGGVALILGLVALTLTVPRLARSAVVERAEARGLVARVGSARLGLGRVWLREVVIEDPVSSGSRVELSTVEVRLGLGGVRGVRVSGGDVRLAGSAEQLEERLRTLRAPKGTRATTESLKNRELELDVSGIGGRWSDGRGHSVILWGAAFRSSPSAGPALIRLDLARAAAPRLSGEVRALEVDLVREPTLRVQRVEAAELNARVNLESAPAEPATGGAAGARAPPSPSAVPPSPGAAPPSPSAVPSGADEMEGGLLASLRGTVQRHLGPRFLGSIVAVTLEVARGGESLRVGPSRLGLTRDGDTVSLEVAPHPKNGGGTPLGLRARLPLAGDGVELEVTGGPVSLAALGVREGDFGLVGVREARLAAEAKVVLASSNAELEVTTRGRLENARLFRPALAPAELSGIGLGWRLSAKAELDGGKLSVKNGELSLGQVRAEISGELEQSLERTRVALDVGVPLASCAALLDALPHGAAPLLSGVRMAGTFALKGHVAYDSQKPSATAVKLDVANGCKIPEVPETISPARFRKPWTRDVKGVRGPMQIESGPGTPDWTRYEDISPHMETAVLVCEDEGFFRHHGFAYRAIESSIQQNLIEGRFFRGASTVSMQLAKNLYLGREKTLSRKLQEAVLTMVLEQELSKHEIMELYLNVIEFGPGIYGIRQASRYYFNEEPRNLSLGQALYLGSILPSPDVHHFVADGRVSDKWMGYLRKLMHIAHKIQRISDEELEEGLQEQVAFRRPNLLGNVVDTVDESQEQEPAVPELP